MYGNVSKSGYYKYRKTLIDKQSHEFHDREEFSYILKAFSHRGFKKGSRTIYMILMREGHPMSRNKIRRLMRKYNLFCPIRKPNIQVKISSEIEVNAVVPNKLMRQFENNGPRYSLLTDITYLFYGNCKKCYLSVIKDAYTKEILGYKVSNNM